MEKELTRLESLNLSGQIAAGISHEIRNPMTTVRGFLQRFRSKEAFKQYSEQLDLMIEEIDRANSIITEFLSVSKDRPSVQNKHNLNDIINKILPLLQSSALESNHLLDVELREVPDLNLDEQEIRQLVLNLIGNAFEAAPPTKKVTIKTRVDDGAVIMSVANEGDKIEDDVLKKIGTPFFTTKEKGTGLGLTICYRIVEEHHANLMVESEPGETTFSVRFSL
jgi:signal transduction histidine kinase